MMQQIGSHQGEAMQMQKLDEHGFELSQENERHEYDWCSR
jgi:hypothetical protein